MLSIEKFSAELKSLEKSSNGKKKCKLSLSPEKLKLAISIRDYAMNNIIAVVTADGEITNDEANYLDNIAWKLKYSRKNMKKRIMNPFMETDLSEVVFQ
ncbi:MAG: hypothetical protein GY775_20275 [Candidatus Scalindua sp.]|nr:hypothetical protein [Candidatus Scalindua sp.]